MLETDFFNDDKVSECLDIDYSDSKKMYFNHKSSCPDFNYYNVIQSVVGVVWNLNPNVGHLLTINYRILFHFITHVVVPKFGKQNAIIIFSLLSMWCALHGKWVNLGYIIILIISTILRHHKSHLSYKMIITKILKAYGVHILSNEETLTTSENVLMMGHG